MPVATPLNIRPYWDDHNPQKDFYKILFQPGTSVQTRELNQLQTLLQQQIERFGDNIFKAGTLVSGCLPQFFSSYAFAKLQDLDFEGNQVNGNQYTNYSVINETSGLRAWIINFVDGFESTAPDLKTLYLTYQNHGTNGTTTAFTPGDVLKVYDPTLSPLESIKINNGGTAFGNSDQCIAVSALVCTLKTGSLALNDYLVNGLGANVQIMAIDTLTYANTGQTLLRVAPRAADLANGQVNSAAWSLPVNSIVTNPAASVTVSVDKVVGSGFLGKVQTNGTGTITDIAIINKGVLYTSAPFITVRSIGNITGYSTLDLTGRNFKTNVLVSAAAGAVGNGYAFGLTEGVIYQKGFFLRTNPQLSIVSKYNQLPDNVAVIFTTSEQIVDSNIDPSLLDNAQGSFNEQAPGGDRLKLVPTLELINLSTINTSSNSQPLTICRWKEGKPFLQNLDTQYNVIEQELAVRTEETSGDFVTDPFYATTRSPTDQTKEGEFYNVVIDPGTAYIGGHRVSTKANYNIDVEKGTDTAIANNNIVSLNYGNYIILKNVAGMFQFSAGDTVDLYNAATGFLANRANIQSNTMTPVGAKIGTARIRSLIPSNNTPGTSAGTYNLYVYNVQMNAGMNFRNVKSVYYNGTYKGIADVVLQVNPTSLANEAFIQESNTDAMVFYSGVDSLKNANNIIYSYRTIDQTITISNTGILTKTITDTFPYTGTLSSAQLQDFYVIPLTNDLLSNTVTTGTSSVVSTSANVTGSSTLFLNDFAAGDFIYVAANSTGGYHLGQVNNIINNTLMILTSNCSFANTVATTQRVFPKGVPIPFGFRSGLTGNVDATAKILSLNLGKTLTATAANLVAVAYNAQVFNATQLAKTANRHRFVTVNCNATVEGPWCVGVPDAFRLRGVYIGNSSVSNTGANYVQNFYLDHNQNPDFYDLGYLFKDPKSGGITLAANNYLLIEFDYFTSTGPGFYTTVSYLGANSTTVFTNDSLPFANLTTQVNSFEVPEMFTDSGAEIDLLKYIDFRPMAANTCAPSTVYSTAPVNPAATLTIQGSSKIPLPGSEFVSTTEYYLGRQDSVFVDATGNFVVLSGKPSADINKRALPAVPDLSIKICDINVPPYPDLPLNYSTSLNQILNTRIANQKFSTTRIKNKSIASPTTNNLLPYNQPKVYTMADVGNMDRRLKDVEYYITLNTLESNVVNTFIPSSVDPSLDRFKFGVFVDDFTTSGRSDITNPQYAAQLEDGDIVPTKMTWDVSTIGLGSGNPDFIEWPIVNQNLATIGGVDDPLNQGPVCACNLGNTVAYTQLYRNSTDMNILTNTAGVTSDATVDTIQVTFASNTSVYETINYVDASVATWLQQNQDALYTGGTSTLPNTIGTHEFGAEGGDNIWDPTYIATLSAEQLVQVATSHFWFGFGAVPLDSPTGHLLASGGGADAGFPALTPGETGAQFVANWTSTQAQWFSNLSQLAQYYAQYNVTNNPFHPPPTGGTFLVNKYLPPVVLYFYGYDQPNKFEIYQGTTLIADSSVAVSLTTDDINLLVNSGGGGGATGGQQFFNDYPNFFLHGGVPVQTGSGYVLWSGKITFNYDPANGTNFTIKTTEGASSNRWRWVLAYPIDGASVGCVPQTNIINVVGTLAAQYTTYEQYAWCSNSWEFGVGQINILSGFTQTWNPVAIPIPTTSVVPFDISKDWLTYGCEACIVGGTGSGSTGSPGSSTSNNSANTPSTGIQKHRSHPLELHCVNMKPDTVYQFFDDGVNMSAHVKTYGSRLGDPIVAHPDGKLNILYLQNIPYNRNTLTDPPINHQYIIKTHTFTFIDPSGVVSYAVQKSLMHPTSQLVRPGGTKPTAAPFNTLFP